jgi:hypothetical protein
MKRFVILITLLLLTGLPAVSSDRGVKPQPAKAHFETFFLMNARSTGLRLFIPDQATMKPHKLLQWEARLDAYSRQWLQKKGTISDQQLLEQLFHDVHKQYLKQFTPYAGLQGLLQLGEYNCLSATTFYALILERLGYSYSIVESVNHIVLLVNLPHQQLLLETTDPVKGFISKASEIQERLEEIKKKAPGAQYYNLNLKVFRTIGLRELAGLQFYNYAAWYYNQRDFVAAASQLRKGQFLYKSERFDKVANLLLSSK